ncbi:MAG: hypothetical protein P4M07_24230 [Xanthobacteraceae bacterium]|nr:hypothetical protein [Xanthobacteraceae bacterium]
MIGRVLDHDTINFGELPAEVDALLQRGVAAYRSNYAEADRLFRQALALAPGELPVYFCLYKIHTYRGHLDQAEAAARLGLAEATRQAGWPADWREWRAGHDAADGAARFALYTLKALAFIQLRQGDVALARQMLDVLARLDPTGSVGWTVVAALADAAA